MERASHGPWILDMLGWASEGNEMEATPTQSECLLESSLEKAFSYLYVSSPFLPSPHLHSIVFSVKKLYLNELTSGWSVGGAAGNLEGKVVTAA